ncbi:SRPBCC family protein [Dactylosporangium sp. CA-139066]|uniref:SRPBCC family protein n=1 Tax=Dactylosporangium sp. CA-139066 TaxID=3239930 RepID=UPI003D8B0969
MKLAVLHREYALQGRIDAAAPVTSESSIVIDAPPQRVWAVLADLRSWPEWSPKRRVLRLGEMAPGVSFRWKLGAVAVNSTFAVVEPGRELTWSGVVAGYKAVDQQVLEPLPGGRTRVTMRESLDGPLVRVLFGAKRLRAGHEEYLRELQQAVGG